MIRLTSDRLCGYNGFESVRSNAPMAYVSNVSVICHQATRRLVNVKHGLLLYAIAESELLRVDGYVRRA